MHRQLKSNFVVSGFGLLSLIVVIGLILLPLSSSAKAFNKGDVVFAAFPVGNIKDDAFIVGKVKQQQANGDYLLSVLDYVAGHDYGSSCVPMVKEEDPAATAQGYEKGWEMWKDTTRLDTQRLDYVVPQQNVLPLSYGKQFFVERNNLYIVFGRWKSDAPVMTLDRISRAQREAKNSGLQDLVPVFELVKYHRKTYYDSNNRPLYAFERIAPAMILLEHVAEIFKRKPEFAQKWAAKQRDWALLNKSSYDYFMVEAIDKVLMDVQDLLYEEGIENAGEDKVANLRQLVTSLSRENIRKAL